MTERELQRLGAAAAAKGIASGQFTATRLVESILSRIQERDASVRAWVDFEPERALAQARRLDTGTSQGPLHGVPLAVKDIIDTADLPTQRGSELFAGRQCERDALCVQRLRKAGAIIMGKAVTTEFAYFAPGPTANPHNPHHTPGGSSSGSAAAVADFQVPGALGTQTAGSVIRPAAFNGVFGFKPSYGMFPLDGVLPLAPSLDTLGLFSRELEDLALLGAVLTEGNRFEPVGLISAPRVALLRTPGWSQGSPEMCAALEGFAATLRDGGIAVSDVDAPAFEGLAELQNQLLAFESQETLGPLVARDPTKTRTETRQLLEAGIQIGGEIRIELAEKQDRAETFLRDEVFSRADVILTPAAPGEAPRGLDATGDPLFNRIWTLLGLPCLSLPVGRGPNGLPLAAQIVGPLNRDEALLAACLYLQPHTGYEIAPPEDSA